MSQRERDRLKVLHEVEKGQLRQKQAAAQLGLTDRWVRKLLGRLRAEGDRGVVHRSRGRPSNRKLPEAWRARAVARVQAVYRDFGPTLAGEYLAQYDGISISQETLRQWLIAAGEGSPHWATAAGVSGRTGARGHVRACLAGRARPGALPDHHD